MKWYKHLAKSLNNPFIKELMYEFGSDAYLVFFGTLEIYADNFVPSERYELCVKTRFLRDELLLSNSKLQKILTRISQNPDEESRWKVNFNNDEVIIFIPKFKKLADNYTKDNTPKTCKKLASDLEETFQPIRRRRKKENKEEDKRKKYADAVFLSDDEYNKLKGQIGFDLLSKAIEQLDYSITVKGGKYKDHYKTILNWHKRGFLNATGNQGRNFNSYRGNNNNRQLDPDTAAELDRIAESLRAK